MKSVLLLVQSVFPSIYLLFNSVFFLTLRLLCPHGYRVFPQRACDNTLHCGFCLHCSDIMFMCFVSPQRPPQHACSSITSASHKCVWLVESVTICIFVKACFFFSFHHKKRDFFLYTLYKINESELLPAGFLCSIKHQGVNECLSI